MQNKLIDDVSRGLTDTIPTVSGELLLLSRLQLEYRLKLEACFIFYFDFCHQACVFVGVLKALIVILTIEKGSSLSILNIQVCNLVFVMHLLLYCMTLLFPSTCISWKLLCVDFNRKNTKDCYYLCPCLIWKIKCSPPNTPWTFWSPVLPPGMDLHTLFGPCPALVTPMYERCQCADHELAAV